MKKYGVWITHKDGTNGKWMTDADHGLNIWAGSQESAESYARQRRFYHLFYRNYEVREIPKTDMPLAISG